jgi:hypothetical protein
MTTAATIAPISGRASRTVNRDFFGGADESLVGDGGAVATVVLMALS